MFTIKTSIELPIAHRLNSAFEGLCVGNVSRDGKTKYDLSTGLLGIVHGHNYQVTIELSVLDPELNDCGMVIDFKEMKQIIHSYFDAYDHSMILTEDDPLVAIYEKNYAEHGIDINDTRLFVWEKNPTAEFMASKWQNNLEFLFWMRKHIHPYIKVTVEETQHNSVTFTNE